MAKSGIISSGVLFTDEPVSAVQKLPPYLVIYVEDCLGDGFCKLAVLIEELSVVVITLCLKPKRSKHGPSIGRLQGDERTNRGFQAAQVKPMLTDIRTISKSIRNAPNRGRTFLDTHLSHRLDKFSGRAEAAERLEAVRPSLAYAKPGRGTPPTHRLCTPF